MNSTTHSTNNAAAPPLGRTESWLSSLMVHLTLLALCSLCLREVPQTSRGLATIDNRLSADSDIGFMAGGGGMAGGSDAADEVAPPALATNLFLTDDARNSATALTLESIGAEIDVSRIGMMSQDGVGEHVGAVRSSGGGGTGGGNGSGGTGRGNGGGNGNGTGSGSGFFGNKLEGKRFVFVVDASTSMHHPHPGPAQTRFKRVQLELVETISRLQPDQQFFVIFFNGGAWPMPSHGLVTATDDAKQRYLTWVAAARAGGHTEPEAALKMAVSLRPEVIFFLTDGDFDYHVVPAVTEMNRGQALIHTIGFADDRGEEFLKAIAMFNGGRYRFIPEDEALEGEALEEEPAVVAKTPVNTAGQSTE